jgi:DNA modification methylase
VIVDEQGGLIAGHARVLAAQRLGLDEVPVVVARGWSDAKKRAYILADNRLALNAGWDPELLRLELADLREMGQDLHVIGFAEDEIAALFSDGRHGLTDPDFVPEPLPAPVTQPGEVWLLGRHRLVCGDCTVPAIAEAALAGAKPHLLVSDPPYGVEYDPAWRNRSGMSTSRRTGKVANDDTADWRAAYALFPGDVAYVWHASLRSADFAQSLIASGFQLRAQIIWAKDQLQISRGHYHWQHEPCWFAVRKGATAHWQGDRKQTTLWQIASRGQDTQTEHGTQKPVECMRRPIVNNSICGDGIYEPFCGSGTSIIAAEITGRICHAIEIDPVYVDVAVRRWEAYTGATAQLEAGGHAFAEIAVQRGVNLDLQRDGAARPQA